MGTPLPARNVLCAGPRAQTLTYLPRRRRRVLFSPTISQQVTLPRAAVLLPALGQHRALILLPPGGGGQVMCRDSSAAKTKEGSVTASHHLSTPLQFTNCQLPCRPLFPYPLPSAPHSPRAALPLPLAQPALGCQPITCSCPGGAAAASGAVRGCWGCQGGGCSTSTFL